MRQKNRRAGEKARAVAKKALDFFKSNTTNDHTTNGILRNSHMRLDCMTTSMIYGLNHGYLKEVKRQQELSKALSGPPGRPVVIRRRKGITTKVTT